MVESTNSHRRSGVARVFHRVTYLGSGAGFRWAGGAPFRRTSGGNRHTRTAACYGALMRLAELATSPEESPRSRVQSAALLAVS